MKKVLVLGSSGMVGHVVYHYLNSKKDKYEVLGVSRTEEPNIKSVLYDVEDDIYDFIEFVCDYKPHVIVNCIGVLVQPSEEDPTRAIFVNSCLPHLLEDTSKYLNSRLIHISTDCVFDGKAGPYNEKDWPTERNWYGRTKALGEVVNDRDLTLRTSIIGPELKETGSGLFEWFMRRKGEVVGYTNVMWNGITTLELAKQIDRILDANLSGLYHLTTDEPISKYDLLSLIKEVWQKMDVEVKPTLYSESKTKVLTNNRKETDGYNPLIPSYEVQLKELKDWYFTMPTLKDNTF